MEEPNEKMSIAAPVLEEGHKIVPSISCCQAEWGELGITSSLSVPVTITKASVKRSCASSLSCSSICTASGGGGDALSAGEAAG